MIEYVYNEFKLGCSAQLCNYFVHLCNFGAAHFCNSNLRNFVIETSYLWCLYTHYD